MAGLKIKGTGNVQEMKTPGRKKTRPWTRLENDIARKDGLRNTEISILVPALFSGGRRGRSRGRVGPTRTNCIEI